MARDNLETFHIKGDRDAESDDPDVARMYRQGQHVDPFGTGVMGNASQLNLAPGKKQVDLNYNGKHGRFVVTADVYDPPGGGMREVHVYCPKCHEVSRITSERKAIEWEEGTLSIERWQCTWEMPEGRRQEFGIGLCRASYAVDRNILRDA